VVTALVLKTLYRTKQLQFLIVILTIYPVTRQCYEVTKARQNGIANSITDIRQVA